MAVESTWTAGQGVRERVARRGSGRSGQGYLSPAGYEATADPIAEHVA